MVFSMTAFGRGFVLTPRGGLQVNICSVNRRHLEVICQLPEPLAQLNPLVRQAVQQKAQRGAVTVSATLAPIAETAPMWYQRAAAWEQIAATLGPQWDRTLRVELLLQDPPVNGQEVFAEVCRRRDGQQVEACALEGLFEQALEQALESWELARQQEGTALVRDLEQRCAQCRRIICELGCWSDQIRPQMEQRLTALLGDWAALNGDQQERFAREWVSLIDRADCTEEMVRLQAHLERVEALLRGSEPVGKSLDFLCQEMLRESNTCAGKLAQVRWGTAEPLHLSVSLKTELERMREQSQNLE